MTSPWSGPSDVSYREEMHHYQEGNGLLASSPLARAGGPPVKERAPMPPWVHQARANPAPPPSAGGGGGMYKAVVVPPPAKATFTTTTTTTTTITTSTTQASSPPPVGRRFPLEEYRRRLVAIYQVHKPDNVPKVDYLLGKYLNQEEYLYQSVCIKYTIDPETGIDKPAFTKAKAKAVSVPPPAQSAQDVEHFKFGDPTEGGVANAVVTPMPKISHEVEEWDPATGQTVVTTVELDEALLEALPELKASLEAGTLPKPAPVLPDATQGQAILDAATNGSLPQGLIAQPQSVSPQKPLDRPAVVTQPVVASPPPIRQAPEDDDEYDPFSTEPNQGPLVRDPREAIAEIDYLLVGEASQFFEAWQRKAQSTPPSDSLAPEASEPVPVLMEIPAIAGEAEASSAPWSSSRRRRRFEAEPLGVATQTPMVPPATRQNALPEGIPAPSVPVAAYEAALLSQVPTLFEIRPPAAQPQSLGVVELLDSDDEVPSSSSRAPVTTAAPLATASAFATAVAPTEALAAPVGMAPVPMDVVELDDSDHETDPNQRPQKVAKSSPAAEAHTEPLEQLQQQEAAHSEPLEQLHQQEVPAFDMEDVSAEAHIDPYLLMASAEATAEVVSSEVRYSEREALVEQLVEEAEAEAEAEEEIAQERALQQAVVAAPLGDAIKTAEAVNEADKDSSSEYTSASDSSEEDGEDKTALAALAAVAQAAEQRAQPVFQ